MKSDAKIFYGWWIVVGACLLNFAGIGIIINSYGVFIKPVTESLGFSRGSFTLYFSIAALCMTFAAPVAGKLLEKFNIRIVMTISTAMMSFSYIFFSQCQTLKQFYLVAAVLGIGSAGSHIIPVSLMITNWFIKRRGLAMGIVFAASGIGGFIFNPLGNWLIISYGWETAYLILGLIMALTTIPTALFIVRAHPREKGLQPYGQTQETTQGADTASEGLTAMQAFRTRSFWLLGIMILFIAIANMGVLHHIVPYLTDLGYSSTTAAALMSLHMAMLIFGKIVLGGFADRVGLSKSLLGCLIGFVIAISLLYGASFFWIAILFNVLFGLTISVRTVLPPLMTSACLGPKHFAVIYGFLNIATTIGTAVGTPLSGYIYDATKSYHLAFAIYMVLGVIAAVAGLIALNRAKWMPETGQ